MNSLDICKFSNVNTQMIKFMYRKFLYALIPIKEQLLEKTNIRVRYWYLTMKSKLFTYIYISVNSDDFTKFLCEFFHRCEIIEIFFLF